MNVTVTRSVSGLRRLEANLQRIRGSEVYVGIPEEKATRKGADEMDNATLMFIQTNGSPLNNIPPRPVIEPAIEASKAIIAPEMAAAAAAVLQGRPGDANTHLKRAGIIGSNAAKAWFTNPANNWAPNAPLTIKRKGSDKPLIDTGQLRRAITYVVSQQGLLTAAEQFAESSSEEATTLGATNAVFSL